MIEFINQHSQLRKKQQKKTTMLIIFANRCPNKTIEEHTLHKPTQTQVGLRIQNWYRYKYESKYYL